MKRITKLRTPVRFVSYSAVGGSEESVGALGHLFDLCDKTDSFGKESYELAEGEMGRIALNTALSKAHISHEKLDAIIAGDLQNQCVASALTLDSFGAPFVGIYGACSTCTEGLLIGSVLIGCGACETVSVVTTSHNAAAERQFRMPLEYGGQRTPSAQWTSTASGAFVLSCDEAYRTNDEILIKEVMIGKIIDGTISDASNMGAAMSFAAADSILSYFKESELTPRDFDFIVTGDLGKVGTGILLDLLKRELPSAVPRHLDCGLLLYNEEKQDMHSGASGCGTSASVLASYFLPMLRRGEIHRILFLSTGAMMSPSSVLQGTTIKGIAPCIVIESQINKLSSLPQQSF